MKSMLVRCQCPLCNLVHYRQMPDWMHQNCSTVYKSIDNKLMMPCEDCRKKKLEGLKRKV